MGITKRVKTILDFYRLHIFTVVSSSEHMPCSYSGSQPFLNRAQLNARHIPLLNGTAVVFGLHTSHVKFINSECGHAPGL